MLTLLPAALRKDGLAGGVRFLVLRRKQSVEGVSIGKDGRFWYCSDFPLRVNIMVFRKILFIILLMQLTFSFILYPHKMLK